MKPSGQAAIGFWCEAFLSAVTRVETNYTGLDYLPGLAKLPETTTQEHSLTAYWGAARDRIPDAAFDLFAQAENILQRGSATDQSSNKTLFGSNGQNLVHIRSGQFWEPCGPEEAEAYETKLEPALESGLQHLWNHPKETGAMAVRYLRNETPDSSRTTSAKRKETCVTGFFTSLGSLEKWAHTHKSHLAIYHGAMNHAKVFGKDRKFRTWHEVSVLERDAVRFQYFNCLPETGVAGALTALS